MKAAPDSVGGVRAELVSELEKPDTVERFAGHQPCCSGHLESVLFGLFFAAKMYKSTSDLTVMAKVLVVSH